MLDEDKSWVYLGCIIEERILAVDPGSDWMFTPAETAAYIATMSEGLTKLARAAGLNKLAFVLSMAALESRGGDRADRIHSQEESGVGSTPTLR